MSGFLLVAVLCATAVLAGLIFGCLDRHQARASVRRHRTAREAEARLRHAVHVREQAPGTNDEWLAICQAIWNRTREEEQR
jgi:hypothetical protein